jgi:hypothetical protein
MHWSEDGSLHLLSRAVTLQHELGFSPYVGRTKDECLGGLLDMERAEGRLTRRGGGPSGRDPDGRNHPDEPTFEIEHGTAGETPANPGEPDDCAATKSRQVELGSGDVAAQLQSGPVAGAQIDARGPDGKTGALRSILFRNRRKETLGRREEGQIHPVAPGDQSGDA